MSIKDLKSEDLYATCEVCNGTGRKVEVSGNWTQEGPCYACGQAGIILTEAGKVLKDFINKVNQR